MLTKARHRAVRTHTSGGAGGRLIAVSMHVGDLVLQGPTPNRWISESDRSRSDDAESMRRRPP